MCQSYTDARFRVCVQGSCSQQRGPETGISRRCPQSPFSFSMLMTVLLSDANNMIPRRNETGNEPSLVTELVYADDTLVAAIEGERANEIMRCSMHVGTEYGVSLNRKKVKALFVRCDVVIPRPDGSHVQCKHSLSCLGALLTSNGSICR